MILVDTSVWIHHLRRDNAELRALLEAGQVVTHPFVIGELACGTLRRRSEVLASLSRLPQLPTASHDEALQFVGTHALAGRGLGWVDVHLLASAAIERARVITLDRSLATAVARLGLA
jgi:predicted nucleic acid-binding protein